MSIVTNVFAYVFVFRLTDKKTKRTEEHTVKAFGYSLNEAMTQATYALFAEQDIDVSGYDMKIIFAGPDIEIVMQQLTDSMKKGAK